MSQELGGLFNYILDGRPDTELDEQFPFYPLHSPGMPMPGPNFLRAAEVLGDAAPKITGKGAAKCLEESGKYLHYLYRRALYDSAFALEVSTKGRAVRAPVIPGHIWGADTKEFGGGPRRARVLVLGKHPGQEELTQRRNFVGPTSHELYRALNELGVPDAERDSWYITNVVKWPQLDRNANAVPTDWFKDCAPLLAQELRLVRPDFILCLGTEASKTLLGTNYNVTSMVGRVMEHTFHTHEWGEPEAKHTARVMTSLHPAAVARKPELYQEFFDQLSLFWQLISGGDIGNDERDIDHAVIYKERELAKIVDMILADPNPESLIIAVDGEWDKDYPTEPGAYLRTVQFSYKDKWARCVVLRHQGGAPAFKPSPAHAIAQLKRLLKRTPQRPVRVGGHFFRSDIPWLAHEGLDLREEYELANGGWDSSNGYHAYNETAQYKLEVMATRLTTAPRYDVALQNWKKEYCRIHKIDPEDLDGYGECPDRILHPYGNYDADVTRRSRMRLMKQGGLLDSDWNGNSSWRAYENSQRASPAFLEMETTGFLVDRKRADEIAKLFMEASERLLREIQKEANWEEDEERGIAAFNPGSAPQCTALLYGDQYAFKLDKATGERVPLRPPGALTLNLQPLKSTGKRSKDWADLIARGEVEPHEGSGATTGWQRVRILDLPEAGRKKGGLPFSPSTDKEVMGILGYSHPLVAKIRDWKFVRQVLQSVLRKPAQDKVSHQFITDDDGNYIYTKGLMGSIHADGRVRTHMSQLKETGRASSYRPPLHNLSSRREDDYQRILGEAHKHPVRSLLCVPEDCIGIEADLTGAELAVLAWLCQDLVMIDHVRRNNLPEDHPDHWDIHSRQAIKAFGLTDVVPTKSGMKKAGKKSLRVAAKNVNFGIPYGRMAPAITRQCHEEGAMDVTEHDCELMIDAYFDTYKGTDPFLQECRERSQDPGWICNPWGRFRRFIKSTDRQVIGEQERQAQNFPIQSSVADAVSQALFNLKEHRKQFSPQELDFRITLQVHDSIVLLVPVQHAWKVYHEVLPLCMCDQVPFWPTYLDGRPMPNITQPYHFGSARECFTHWGEAITAEVAKERNLPDWLIKGSHD